MPTKLILPNNYISWSQLTLFEKCQRNYIERYITREKQSPVSVEMTFGKNFAEALENGDDGSDPLITALCSMFPKYQSMEYEIKADIDGIPVLGKLDSYNPETFDFYEYKTGRVDWTHKRVRANGQLTFYAMLIYLQTKQIPKQIELVWAETEKVDNIVSATGHIRHFKTKRDMQDILEMMARVSKAAKKIDKIYKKSIKEIF